MTGRSILLDALYAGRVRAVTLLSGGESRAGAPQGLVVLAGSFNPLHEGHFGLARAAARLADRDTALELSIENVEKPELARVELERRLGRLGEEHTVIVTRAPTFAAKAALMPDTVFAVGYDTATRLLDARFYRPYDAAADPSGAGSAVALALGRIRSQGSRFAVGGRLSGGRFRTLRELAIPAGVLDMFTEIPESEFRADVSSTQMRDGR